MIYLLVLCMRIYSRTKCAQCTKCGVKFRTCQLLHAFYLLPHFKMPPNNYNKEGCNRELDSNITSDFAVTVNLLIPRRSFNRTITNTRQT